MSFIDRRTNPRGKSHVNRQRFLRRVRSHLRGAVDRAIEGSGIRDVGRGGVSVTSGGDISEPRFVLDPKTGDRDSVLPGNRDYMPGDRIAKPPGGGGGGNGGSPDGDGVDPFNFLLTRDEFLDLFFEDLRLPNLAKKQLRSIVSHNRVRAGLSNDAPPSRLNLLHTMRRSLGRRIALNRPTARSIEALVAELETLEAMEAKAASNPDDPASTDHPQDRESRHPRIEILRERIEAMRRRMRAVPYLDTVDLRFNHYDRRPEPTTGAVMFCLMDTSASMTEELKLLAKRFYILLHLFLRRHYKNVEVVFIRHTYVASEVDEDTFFHGRDTGGTIVSSALHEMQKVIAQRYPASDWNIYAAQASDGHNFDHDMPQTLSMLREEILPRCQYYAYIEVSDDLGYGLSALWRSYQQLLEEVDHFQMARVCEAADIYPVFHQLFRGGDVASSEA